MLERITALVLTLNEKENIGRTLAALRAFDRVLVIDSFSTDGTVEIAKSFGNVGVLQRHFVSFADQCNWGLSQIQTAWVLSMDADYILTAELIAEIQHLPAAGNASGYSARFKYCINGAPLRSTLLPPRTVLYRKDVATYNDVGHGHGVKIAGTVHQLSGFILHDDRKPLSRWLQSQDRYMKIEAPHLLASPNEQLSLQDRLRKRVFFAAPIMFFYLLFVRGLILDGWPGWYYVAQRTLAELLLSLRLLNEKRRLEVNDQ